MPEAPNPQTMRAVSARTVDVVVAVQLALFANVPLALWGAPGTGKTSLLRSITEQLSWPLFATTAAIHDPTDFSGISFLSGGTLRAHTMRAPLDWAVTLAEEAGKHHGNGLIFFDDIGFAPLGVQNALLQIVLERRVDQFQLPDGIRCAAALEPLGSAPDASALTAPLANRMVHLPWAPDAAWWVAGVRSGWSLEFQAVPPNWEDHLPTAQERIAAFIEQKPELLNREPADRDGQSGPWPSGRTWDMLSRLLAVCDAVAAGAEVRRLLATGTVGRGAGTEYLVWERELGPGARSTA